MRTHEKNFDSDVTVIGAGPVGLTIANIIGAAGLRVIVLDQLDKLIDYPRGVGLDDEALRVFQAIGLADDVARHITPFHWVRIYNARRKLITKVEPRQMPFGWSRRNAFHQPLADKALYDGLARFPNVQVLFDHNVERIGDDDRSVSVEGHTGAGKAFRFTSRYLVGADGGRSITRKHIGAGFEGTTKPEPFLVIDIAEDPIGRPNLEFVCDARLPFVSIALPHGVRRFEFSVPKDQVRDDFDVSDEFVTRNLNRIKPGMSTKNVIRRRVYYHSARLSSKFREGRVILAGDAARLMPVWQGQGYNSGIRDAMNISWKLIFVLREISKDALLNTYHEERWQNSKDMIAVSVLMGKIFNPGPQVLCLLRDWAFGILDFFPRAKHYVTTMSWKPIPKLSQGVIVEANEEKRNNPVGTLFIQPPVIDENGSVRRFDDLVGLNFAVLSWGYNPDHFIDDEAEAVLTGIGAKRFAILPQCQSGPDAVKPGTFGVIYDQGALKDWFDPRRGSVVILRPDKVVAAICEASDISETVRRLAHRLCLV